MNWSIIRKITPLLTPFPIVYLISSDFALVVNYYPYLSNTLIFCIFDILFTGVRKDLENEDRQSKLSDHLD